MVSGRSTSLHTLRLLPKWAGYLNTGATLMVTTWFPGAPNASMTHHPDLEEFLSFPYISLIQCATSVSQSVLTPHCLLSVQSLYSLTIFVHILCLPTMHSLLPAIHLSLFRFTTLTFSSSNLEEEWQATPVFLPGKSHGQRTLVGYSPCSLKELDTTEQLNFHIPAASGVLRQLGLSCKFKDSHDPPFRLNNS